MIESKEVDAGLETAREPVVAGLGEDGEGEAARRDAAVPDLDTLAFRESVSFVIPARNEERFLGMCLDSISAQSLNGRPISVEIIVVDNESTDGTARIATERGCRVVSVPPGSVSRARNRGAAAASGAYLAFVDADCELPTDWLARCLSALEDLEIVAAGTKVAAPNADATWVEREWHDMAYQFPGRLQYVAWLPTINLMVRRSAFEKVGGFDERLVTCEDADLGYRLTREAKMIRDHQTGVYHHGESKSLREFYRREAWRSRGNIPSAVHNGVGRGELPSLILPPLFLVCLTSGGVSLVVGCWWSLFLLPGFAVLEVALSLPLMMVFRYSTSLPYSLWSFSQRYVLAFTYLLARGVGTFTPARRVER